MSAFRRMMSYLGLVDDDEYEEYEGWDEQASTPQPAARPARGYAEQTEPTGGSIRTLPAQSEQASGITVAPRTSSVVRPLTPVASTKPHSMTPASFQDAKEIADRLKAGVAVIVNLQNADRDLMRRIVDFASGLTYGLDGEMERTADRVYLLTPPQR